MRYKETPTVKIIVTTVDCESLKCRYPHIIGRMAISLKLFYYEECHRYIADILVINSFHNTVTTRPIYSNNSQIYLTTVYFSQTNLIPKSYWRQIPTFEKLSKKIINKINKVAKIRFFLKLWHKFFHFVPDSSLSGNFIRNIYLVNSYKRNAIKPRNNMYLGHILQLRHRWNILKTEALYYSYLLSPLNILFHQGRTKNSPPI